MNLVKYQDVACITLKNDERIIVPMKNYKTLKKKILTETFIDLGTRMIPRSEIKELKAMKGFEYFIHKLEPNLKAKIKAYFKEKEITNPSENYFRWLMFRFNEQVAQSSMFQSTFHFDKEEDRIFCSLDVPVGEKVKKTYTVLGITKEVEVYSDSIKKNEYIDFKEFHELLDMLKDLNYFSY